MCLYISTWVEKKEDMSFTILHRPRNKAYP